MDNISLEQLRKKLLVKFFLSLLFDIILIASLVALMSPHSEFGKFLRDMYSILFAFYIVFSTIYKNSIIKSFENSVKIASIQRILDNITKDNGTIKWHTKSTEIQTPVSFMKIFTGTGLLDKINSSTSKKNNSKTPTGVKPAKIYKKPLDFYKSDSDDWDSELDEETLNLSKQYLDSGDIEAAEEALNFYAAGFGVDEWHVEESRLFKKLDYVISDDVFTGKYKNTNIKISETKFEKGRGKYSEAVFQGIWLEIETKNEFKGHTIISRKNKHINREGFNKLEIQPKDFGSKFVVYTNNVQEASEILTPPLCNYLMGLKYKTYMAFYDSQIIVAVDIRGDLFKLGSIFKSLNNQNQYVKFIENFSLLLGIVDKLKSLMDDTYICPYVAPSNKT